MLGRRCKKGESVQGIDASGRVRERKRDVRFATKQRRKEAIDNVVDCVPDEKGMRHGAVGAGGLEGRVADHISELGEFLGHARGARACACTGALVR